MGVLPRSSISKLRCTCVERCYIVRVVHRTYHRLNEARNPCTQTRQCWSTIATRWTAAPPERGKLHEENQSGHDSRLPMPDTGVGNNGRPGPRGETETN